jgi:hypothetical protein
MGSTATYIYCIVHAARMPKTIRVPPGLPGSTAPSVLSVSRSLWLVVADVPLDRYGSGPLEASLRDMDWVAAIAVAHESVVEHCARLPRATVVPMKLFTMFSSSDRAIEDVRGRRADIQAIVKRIAGCEEWGVRMTRTAARSRTKRPVETKQASGIAFLAAKKEARDVAREAVLAVTATADHTFSSLAAIARDARRRDDVPEGVPPPLLDAAFLVPATRRSRFRAAVRRLARDTVKVGADVTLSGPWPAYNFVQSGSGA